MGLFLWHFRSATVDEEPPVVSNGNLNPVSSSQLDVTWNTDEPAIYRMKIQKTGSLAVTGSYSSVYNTSHFHQYLTLDPGAEYTLWVQVKDALGNESSMILLGTIVMPT